MNISIRKFELQDIQAMRRIWNEVVEEANAFPQETGLANETEAQEFFASQTFTAVAECEGEILGLYILHPNNIGRCASIANASYAVSKTARGKGIGQELVKDCLAQAKNFGYHVLQFNAVVATNFAAVHLYEKLGFEKLGTIPACFRKNDGNYEDLILFFHRL